METTLDALTAFFRNPDVQRGLVLIGLKSALILALAALVAFALREASAARRHLIWAMALGSVLLLPVLELALPAWRVGLMEATAPMAPALHHRHAPHAAVVAPVLPEGGALVMAVPPVPPVPEGPAVMVVGTPASFSLPPVAWLGLLWIGGIVAVGLYYLVGLLRLNGWTGRAEPVEDAHVRQVAKDVVWELDVSRPVALRWTEEAVTPLTFGILRPVVLLPRAAAEWDAERLRVVLLHEFAHIRRLDALTQTIAQVACALFWFNPLVWWGAHRLRVERERACDDYVLARGTRASSYAAHLLEIARSLRGRTPVGVVSMAHRGELEGRLLAILEPERRREILTRAVTIVAGVAFAAVLLPLAAFKPWDVQAQHLTTTYAVPVPLLPPTAAAPASPLAPLAPLAGAAPIPGTDDVIRRTFSVRPGGMLEVQTDIGSIVVEPGSSGEVEVEVEHNLEGFDVKFDQRGNTVSVRGDRERRSNWNWGRNQRAQFRIRVPEHFNVNLHTSGGSIHVGDLEGTVDVRTSGGSLRFGRIRGEVQARTSGGSIQLDGATGNVNVNTSGGSIRLGPVGGTVRAETSGGSISLDEVGGDVQAETSGGSISATITRQPRGQSRLKTSGGSIRVQVAEGVNLDLDARTSAGRVTSDFHPDHRRSRGGGDALQGKIGRGGPGLHLRTSAGTIRVTRMDGRSSAVRAERDERHRRGLSYSYTISTDDGQIRSGVDGSADLGENLSGLIAQAMEEAFGALEEVDWHAEMNAALADLSGEALREKEAELAKAQRELESARRELSSAQGMTGEIRREVERALRESERAIREAQRAIEARCRDRAADCS